MGGLFGGSPQKVSSTAPEVSGLRMQTSARGRAIPLVYGKTRVAANVIWYGDFRAVEHRSRQSAGGKGGGGGSPIETVSYSYEVAVQLALCEGPVRGIGTVWVGKNVGTLGTWNLSQFTGGPGQQPMPYQLSRPALADAALSYRGTAYVATGLLALGDDPSLPNMSFEVDSTFGLSDSVRDANPADVLADLVGNTRYGLGARADALGDLTALRQWCQAAGLLVSPAYTEQQPARELLSRLLQIAAAGVYYSEGRIKAVPLANSPASGNGVQYSPDLTPAYDLGDDDFLQDGDSDPVQCRRTATADVYNCVRVKFVNRASGYNDETVEAKDPGAIARDGLRLQELELHELADANVARLVAQLALQRGYVRNRYQFRLGWRFALLEPTDLVTLSDAGLGLTRALVRITEIEEDEDGTLSVQAEEVPIGTVNATRYPTQASNGYAVNHNTPPGAANRPVIFEPPLALAGAPEIWLAASGSSDTWGGCDVWVSDDNATYQRLGRLNGKCRHGVLAAPLPASVGIDTANLLRVDVAAAGGVLLAATQQNADQLVSLCYVDGELLAYRDATLTAPGRYDLGYLVRGAWGTPISSHGTGSAFARLDQSIAKFGYDKARVGRILYIKLQSFNIYGSHTESLAELTVYPYQIKGAALADVTGLALEQPFSGRSCKIRWNAVDGAIAYNVEVWGGSPQALRRSVAVGDTRRYEYSWEDATADGGPWRQISLRVRAISATGASGNWATVVANNPVPPALTGISVSPGYNAIFFACSQPADLDAAGLRVWLSTVAGFTPGDGSLVYDGPDYTTTLYQLRDRTPLQAGTTYYLRAAAFDAFGKDGLQISSEYTVSPVSVAGGLKPGDIDAAMVRALDTAKLTGTLKDWQLESINAAKIAGQLVDGQLAALHAAKLVGQLNDSQLAAMNASKLIGQLQDSQLAALSVDKLLGKVPLNQLAADVQGPLASAVSTANQALAKANDAATATSVQQLQARLSNTDSTVASSLTRLGNVESTLAGKASASDVTSLQARLNNGGDIRNDIDTRASRTELSAQVHTLNQAIATTSQTQATRTDTIEARLNSGDIKTAIGNKADKTALDAAVTRLTTAETNINGKAGVSDLNALRSEVRTSGRNMLDVSGWVPGSTHPAQFSRNGTEAENSFIFAAGPFGETLPLWRCVADGSNNNDGGWNHTAITINPKKSYRFSVWLRPVSGRATAYLGTSTAKRMTGVVDSNPYFAAAVHDHGGVPLINGRWYLMVGFRLSCDYTGPDLQLSGIYDAETGAKVFNGMDLLSQTTDTAAIHRAYQFYGSTGAEQWFALPRMELLDGNEPAVADLLAGGARSAASGLATRLTTVETGMAGKAAATDVLNLQARLNSGDIRAALDSKAGLTDLSALANRVISTETAITGKASASDVTSLQARLSTGGDILTALNNKAAQSGLDASNTRLSAVEVLAAGKAATSTVTALQARVGSAEASVTTLTSAQASLDGRVSGKWGVAIEATLPDGRKKLSGLQAFNDGSTASFVISADQLLIQGAGSALNPDPYFQDASCWHTYAGSWAIAKIPDGRAGDYALRSLSRPAEITGARPLPFDPGKNYRVKAWARGLDGANGKLYLGVQLLDSNGSNLSGNGTFWYTTITALTSAWAECVGFIGPNHALVPPSGAKSWRPIALLNYAGTAGYMELQAFEVEEVLPSTLIQNGAITTDKIAANAILADKIAANSISSTHIVVGSLTGDRLAVNSISGDKIQAGTLTANHIDTRNLTIKDAAGNVIFGAGQSLDVGRITGLGSLATANNVGVSQVSGLGPLATANGVNVNQVTGLGSLATANNVGVSQVSGLGPLATANGVNVNQVTGLGSLATANNVGVSQVSGLGPLATKAQVAASDMAVGSLSAISANLGTVTAGNLSIQSDGAGGWGKLQSGNKWWNDGQNGWVLAREPGGGSVLEFQGGSTLLRMSSWGDCLLRFGDKVEMRGDGFVRVRRIAVAEPDIVASGTIDVQGSWWLGEYYTYETPTTVENGIMASGYRPRTQTILIDTQVNYPDAWNVAPSDMFGASATIAGGHSSQGGGTGYGRVHVAVGDGLSQGGGGLIDNRIYICYIYEHIGNPILISRVKWKLVRL